MDTVFRNRKLILIGLILTLVYFATRLYSIMDLQMFTDEAIYTRWSQIARFDANWRFISLTDGKQPSFVWINMVLMKLVDDPLLAGRLVSVVAGFFGMAGMFYLAREVFHSQKIGIVASALYVVYPFTLVYDRMALYESLVAAATIWGIWFHVLLIRRRRLDVALILGMIIGFAVLTKSSGFFLIYLFPLSLLLFDFKQKSRVRELLKWVALASVSALMAYGFYSVLRLSPFFHIVAEKNGVFVYPIHDWINHPLEFFRGNWNGLTDWLISYSTIPLLAMMFGAFLIGGKKYLREKLFLLLWFAGPFIGLAMFGRILYPRFILFMAMPLLVLASYSLINIWEMKKNSFVKIGIIALVFGFLLRSDFYVITDLARAPIAKADTDQFVNAWPAGGGVREVVAFLKDASRDREIYVATEGTFGSLPTYTTEIYLDEIKNIKKRGIWPTEAKIPEDLVEKAEKMRVFYILNDSQVAPNGWPVRLVARYQKGIGHSYMSLYEVLPSR